MAKKRRGGLLRWLFRQLFRLIIACGVLIGVVFAGCYVYFVYAQPLGPRLDAAVQARVAAHHIHKLSYHQIPEFYRSAVIATEDRRFDSDPGIDFVGITRSIFVDIQRDGYIEGGSTITQQLVDNTLLNRDKTIRRKVPEILYAIGVYDTQPKQDTFTDYANVIYFGHQAYGLENAAETYFGRSVSQLNQGELAMLAGLPNAPSAYDPFVHMNLARQREQMVLENMVDDQIIDEQAAKAIFKDAIRLKARQ